MAIVVVPVSISATTSTSSTCCISYVPRRNYPFCYKTPCYVACLSQSSTRIQPAITNNTSTSTTLFPEDFFIAKYNFSPEIASKVALASARMKRPQNPDLVLSFLEETGFSHAHLERIVRHHSVVLSSCPENIKPKFKIFQELGFSAGEVIEVISGDFTILYRGANRIILSLSVLKRLLGSNEHVIKFIKKCRSLFYVDPEKTLLPNIEFLKSCGIQGEQIDALIYSYPHLFLISPENLRRCVHRVDEIGVERTSKMFIYAVNAVSKMSDETLKLKLKYFQDLGFSENDILRVFRSYPPVIAVSIRKIEEVIRVLLATGKYDMSCIIKKPASLMFSVEKRYKPRLKVLKALEKRSLIDNWPSLSKLYTISNKRFFEEFVAPNLGEVGEDFVAKTSVGGKLETATSLKTI